MGAFKQNREAAVTSVLVSPDRELANQFLAAVQDQRAFEVLAELREYPSTNTLDIRLRQTRPEAVLIDAATDLESAIGLIGFLASMDPPVLAVGLHWRNESDSVIRVLRAGASEFLHSPFDPAAQREAAARLKKLGRSDRGAEVELGKVYVFTAAKPGSGTSTLATHAAHAVRGKAGKRVLLIDLDLEGGSVGFYLKLPPAYSVADALEHADRMDAAVWSALTVQSNGIDVLAAPEIPQASPIDPARLHDVLEYARMLYDYVIVDAPPVFHRTALLALSECDQACLVSSADLASLHLARKAVGFLSGLGFEKERYQVVVNRVSRKDGIAPGDMEKIFNSKVYASVPNEYFSLHRVISLGQPLAADCELGRAIAALASKLASAGAAAPKLPAVKA
jgi:pilus assembly protein CpaE